MLRMTTTPLPTRQIDTGPGASRRIAVAALAGTTIEFYDFLVYGTAAALVFGTVFFPALGAVAGTAAALATVGVAPLVRPVGAVVFGHLGDRLGRKRTLIYTLLLMGSASVAVGLLPGTAAIGGAAPAVLVALRVLQGIAVGGEWGGAALLAVENARPGRRGSFGMYPQLGHGIAFALTSTTFLAAGLTMSREAFLAWGWRIPFLLSVVLVGLGLYVRLRVEETPVFRSGLARHGRSRVPLGEAFRRHAGQILLAGGALSPAFAFGYLGTVYLTSYGTAVLARPLPTVLLLGILGGGVLAAFTALSARLSDRFGRRRIVLGGNVAAAVGLARVLARLAHDLVRDAARVRELEPLGPEPLDLGDRQARAAEPVRPVADRLRRHGDVDRLGLVGAPLAHPARQRNDRRIADAIDNPARLGNVYDEQDNCGRDNRCRIEGMPQPPCGKV